MVNAHFSTCKNKEAGLKFLYVCFEFGVEAVCLLFHRHYRSFIGVFLKNPRKLLLKNVANSGSTCNGSQNNFVPEVCRPNISEYCQFGHMRLVCYLYFKRYTIQSTHTHTYAYTCTHTRTFTYIKFYHVHGYNR